MELQRKILIMLDIYNVYIGFIFKIIITTAMVLLAFCATIILTPVALIIRTHEDLELIAEELQEDLSD